MNDNEKLLNDIIIAMNSHLDDTNMSILKNVLHKYLSQYNISAAETLPATVDDSNEYILKMFLATKGAKLSPRTVTYYIDTIKKLLATVNKPLTEITSLDISCFLNSLRRDNTAVSLNNRRRNLSAFFTWMRKTHLIIENPCEAVESYKQIIKPIDHMEPTEYEQLKSGCITSRDRAIIEFLRSTAMRVGEMGSVIISQVNWSTGLINILGEKTGAYRPVCLDSVALKYLSQYIADRNLTYSSQLPLFSQTHSNKALSGSGIRDSLKKIRNRAGLTRRVYPHLFRKTTATNIIKRGGSIHDAGEYLGHKDSSTAGRHYTYIGSEHTLDIFRRYVAAV